MSESAAVKLVVVGSIGIDTIETPWAKRKSILGGSASYACASAGFFTSVGMVGVVGTDFPEEHKALYQRMGVDLQGLQQVPGETFRWSGVYEEDMNQRRTISTELNVFKNFSPEIPAAYRESPFLFLANISPELQLRVLDQMRKPLFVTVDTMDLWINMARDKLMEVIARVDMLALNESEARQLTGKQSLLKAAQQLLQKGPRMILLKKGEHGSLLIARDDIFVMPAYPVFDVLDPTGAGDTFAGGFMGALAAAGQVTKESIRRAILYGTVVASFGVEAFSLDRLQHLARAEIDARAQTFQNMLRA